MQIHQVEISYREDIYELPDEPRGSWSDRYPIRMMTYHEVWIAIVSLKLHADVRIEQTLNMAPDQ